MKILLISFLDSSNIGDKLIVETFSKDLSKFGKVKIISYNLTTEKNSTFNFDKISHRNYLQSYYQKYIRRLEYIDMIHGILNRYRRKNLNWGLLDAHLKDCDLVVFGGGNVFYGLTKYTSPIYQIECIVNHIKQMDIPLLFLSIGIGPFKSKEQINLTYNILNQSNAVSVRDKASLNYINKLDNAYDSVDPVLFIKNVKTNFSNDSIGICIMDIRTNKSSEKEYRIYINEMTKLILDIRSTTPEKNIYLYSSEPVDYIAVNEVYEKLAHSSKIHKKYIDSPDELINFYKIIDLIIGTRMHSMILGFTQGIPLIGISWQPKVKEFFSLIKQEKNVFEITNLSNKLQDIVKLVKTLSQDENKINIKISYEDSKNELLKKYNINNEIISKVMKDK